MQISASFLDKFKQLLKHHLLTAAYNPPSAPLCQLTPFPASLCQFACCVFFAAFNLLCSLVVVVLLLCKVSLGNVKSAV